MRAMTASLRFGICLGALAAGPSAYAADAAAGKSFFRQQCAICHTAEAGDNGGAQGPSLIGIYGRHAASASGFSYSAALRAADLNFDAPTLSRFLASPTTVAPGTAMVIAVPNPADRDNLIAYFQNSARTASGTGAAAQAGGTGPVSASAAGEPSADWKLDAPGRTHRIDLAALPPPFATSSSRNSAGLVARPANAALALPPGFHIEPFAAELKGPRKMLVAPTGDILVSETATRWATIWCPTIQHGFSAADSTVGPGTTWDRTKTPG
jgi:cytochrome c2